MSGIDQSTRFFNTAIIATKIPKSANCAAELATLVNSPAFQAIVHAIRDHASKAGLSEEQAAEEIVRTFRDMDRVWDSYIFQEGLDRLRGTLSN